MGEMLLLPPSENIECKGCHQKLPPEDFTQYGKHNKTCNSCRARNKRCASKYVVHGVPIGEKIHEDGSDYVEMLEKNIRGLR